GLSLEILDNSQAHYDYSGADSWMLALFYDASLDGTAVERASLPTARWHGQGSNDIAILRSGWGPDDTFLWVSCGDYFGAHQHYEAGSFQLFAHGLLTGSTGYYDAFDSDHWQNYYSQHSVHANTLSIYQPGEFFPTLQSLSDPGANVNDGGQRVLRRDENGTAYPNPDLAAYLSHKDGPPYNETGDLVTFESAECHDYVACDVTAAYNSTSVATNGNTAKVSEVSRQFVFLRPELLVIFDRVEATDAAYEKRFLLHTLGDPQVDGNVFVTDNGGGRLIGQTLLPAQADIEVIANFAVEGTPHPPSNTGNESGGTRLEISPAQEGARDYFLHVLHATTPATTDPPTASLLEDDATATVTIELDGTTYAVTFAKAGDLGGHLTVTTGGSIDCDQDLGEHASSSGAGGGGAGGAGTGGSSSGGGGVTPGSTSADDDSGCGCRQGGARPGGGLPWLGLLGPLAVALRRRRATSHRAGWLSAG
ncbi:MAG: heparinase II/III family protein, partial [Deltaproteobacteria bacterium]|nr:heparinase II/III family protein [Deltaproteobacteria bacterium]